MEKRRFSKLPASFGRYTVLKQLGAGGMGEVYLARDSSLNRKVALKIPHIKADHKEQLLKRFRREARLAAALDHPSLVRVFDVGEHEGAHYLSMAYIKGKSLQSVLAVKGRLKPSQAARLTRHLAAALYQAHKAGVTHRDLKPSNIMIGEDHRPIIVDFGLARPDELFGDEQAADLTRDGQLIGTPWYMSPEQVKGDPKGIGPQSDIFSLGVILYEMLAGQLPFTGSLGDVIGQISHKDPEPLTQFGIAPSLDAICFKAIAKQRSERYSSMKEFARALEQWRKQPTDGSTDSDDSFVTNDAGSSPSSDEVPAFVTSATDSARIRRSGKPGSTKKLIVMSWFVNLAMMAGMILVLYLAKDYVMALLEPRQVVVEKRSVNVPGVTRRQPTRETTGPSTSTTSPRNVDEPTRTERRWQSVFRALPSRFSLGAKPVPLHVGTVPNSKVPWEITVQDKLLDLGDTKSLAVAKDTEKPAWSICLRTEGQADTPIAVFDLTDGKLTMRDAPESDLGAEALQLTSLALVDGTEQRRIDLRPAPPAPITLNLEQEPSEQIVLPNLRHAGRLKCRIMSISFDEMAWESAVKQSSHWEHGGTYWNKALMVFKDKTLPQLRTEEALQLPRNELTTRELDGPLPVRLGLGWDATEAGIVIRVQPEYRYDSRWRTFNLTKDGTEFMDTLRTFDRSFREYQACGQKMKLATQQITKLNAQLAAIPANTGITSEKQKRARMTAQRNVAQTASAQLAGRSQQLQKALRRMQPKANELGYQYAVATALHRHTKIHFQFYCESASGEEIVIAESVKPSGFGGAFATPTASNAEY